MPDFKQLAVARRSPLLSSLIFVRPFERHVSGGPEEKCDLPPRSRIPRLVTEIDYFSGELRVNFQQDPNKGSRIPLASVWSHCRALRSWRLRWLFSPHVNLRSQIKHYTPAHLVPPLNWATWATASFFVGALHPSAEGTRASILKLFEKLYAQLTAGLPHPYRGDRLLAVDRLSQLERLYQGVVTAVDKRVTAVGLK